MTAFVTSNDKPPDLTALLPIAACLRTLVLDLPGVPVNITEVRPCHLAQQGQWPLFVREPSQAVSEPV